MIKDLNELKDKILSSDKNNFSKEELLSLISEEKPKAKSKPIIYFTKLDANGNLTPDKEKTDYYAGHPEELFPKRENPLSLVKEGTKGYDKVLKALTKGKTPEMISAENNVIWQGSGLDFNGVSEPYKNALGKQINAIVNDVELLRHVLDLLQMDDIKDIGVIAQNLMSQKSLIKVNF